MNYPNTPPTEVIDSPGYCIYCGVDDGALTDEHVIPRAVNGHILLKRSTCKVHKDLTSAIEGDIQAADRNGMFANTRLVLGMRSYKKRKVRPNQIKLTFIGHDERPFKKSVPIAEAQVLHHMPVLTQPRLLTHARPLPNNNQLEISAIANNMVNPAIERFIQRQGARALQGQFNVPVGSFLRYLCKIAYGFHFVVRGPFDRSESPALELLLGNRNDFGNWVGGMPPELERHGTDWHRVELVDLEVQVGKTCEAVLISLFNNLTPCTYVVVTRFPGYQSMVV